MKLYLAEHAHQVADFLEKGLKGPANWVALGPGAMHSLGRRGIPYTIPEDYLSREEIEAACEAQFAQLSQACRRLDAALMERDPFLQKWGIRPFFFHLWQLGQVADLLLCRSLILNRLFDDTGASEAMVHLGPLTQNGNYGVGFGPRDTIWGHLLTLPGWRLHIVTLVEPLDMAAPGLQSSGNNSFWPKKVRNFLVSQLQARPRLYTLAISWHAGLRKNLANLLLPGHMGNKPGLAFCNAFYEWSGILPVLASRGHPLSFFNSLDLIKDIHPLTDDGPGDGDELWELFKNSLQLLPVDYSPLLYNRFKYILKTASFSAQSIVKRLKRVFCSGGVKAMLCGSGVDFGYYVAKQYCRKEGWPVISWQHGAEWYNKGTITQRNDLLNLVGCDQILVYGEGVEKGYAASPLAQEEGCRIECVGMPSLKRLRAITPQRPRGASRILWPFGGYCMNNAYCGFSPPHSDRVYYQEQMVILEKLLQLLHDWPHLGLTVKLYASLELAGVPWVEDLNHRERVRIVRGKPTFVELLAEHDLVIIDSPTTTLLQAVATRLPVFTLMSVIRWPEEALRLLRPRAQVADNAQDLMTGLAQYLHGEQLFDVNHDMFLRHYGLGREDGESLAQSLLEKRYCQLI